MRVYLQVCVCVHVCLHLHVFSVHILHVCVYKMYVCMNVYIYVQQFIFVSMYASMHDMQISERDRQADRQTDRLRKTDTAGDMFVLNNWMSLFVW